MTIPMSFEVAPDGAILGQQRNRKQRNPSMRHEALLSMVKLFPETVLRLAAPYLNLGYTVSGPLRARAGDPDAYGLRIDTALEYADTSGRTVVALVVEAQLSGEADLRWRIPAYAGFVFRELRCATIASVMEANFYPEIWEPARCVGLDQGRKAGLKEGQELGEKRGEMRGLKKGVKQGLKRGLVDARRQDILMFLEGRGVDVPDDIRERILRCVDSEVLVTWLRRSVTAATAGEVIA